MAPYRSTILVALCLGIWFWSGARAATTPGGGMSIVALAPDTPQGPTYTLSLAYGEFADVEMVGRSELVGELEIEVFDQDGALVDHRVGNVVNRRPLLASEVLGVKNLFELARPMSIRITASVPVSLMEVRRGGAESP